MAKYLKLIGLLVFALLIWQGADHSFTGTSVSVGGLWARTMAIDGNATDADVVVHAQDAACFNSPQLPYLPDAELANAVGQTHLLTSMRVQRSYNSEYLLSLKDWVARLCQYQACLSLHREKLYDATAYNRCQPACEYYIYTLRRILI